MKLRMNLEESNRQGEDRSPSGRRTARRAVPALALAVLLLTCTALAQDYGNDKPPPEPKVSVPPTDEQKTALRAIDVRLAGVEQIAAKIDDPSYKATTDSAIADLKRRRKSLEKNFEPALSESLMHSVISRYQIIALWLTPARLPPPLSKATATAPATPEKKSETKS